MKTLYGYLLTGWLFAALSAWHNRQAQGNLSLFSRLGLAAIWILAWPLAVIAVFILTIARRDR